MFSDIIIMAGGSGTRLWPASNSKVPKQFLPLPDGSTFFGASLDRAIATVPAGAIVVVAGASHVPHVIRAAAALPEAHRSRVVVIPEPVGRNTAPALACAAVYLDRAFGNGRRALVLTSDHVIGPIGAFRADAEAADALAAQERLVVFGIPPRGPETGFGYIEAGEPIDLAKNAAPGRTFAVASFREKPDLATAERFLASGGFTWNSGMFGFGVDFMLRQFREHSPDTLAPFAALAAPKEDAYESVDGVRVLSRWSGLEEAYRTVKGISIDYAMAEKCRSVAVVAAGFDWTDIGSWDEYARFLESGASDAPAGKQKAPVFAAGARGCWVDSDLPVALCGVEDLIVVVRSGADGSPPSVLVCKRGESQKVKDAVEAIKAAGRPDLL
jgi:mannose-1-phosphate guanylyltransferase/mannose-1-phosphate guanylyltransferase/mannose-6-phosphate isomerase